MAYERGTASTDVELARVQGWIEVTDPELWGGNGQKGMFREFHDHQSEIAGMVRLFKFLATVMAIFGGIPTVIVILQLLHVIPR